MNFESDVIAALREELPSVVRWSGAVAKRLRQFNISLTGKSSGSANTDALTLADLSVQELLVAALRDGQPVLRQCRIEAEEETGDLAIFAEEGSLTLSIDPIDGTKQYRDRTGDGYAVMVHLRNVDTVLYSLVYTPEEGTHGTWVEVSPACVRVGPDAMDRRAEHVLTSLPNVTRESLPYSKKIYLIGFQDADPARAADVTNVGLEGVPPDDMPGSIYSLMCRGDFGGSLIHTPNVYDFPVALHIARELGGQALWVHNRQPVNFAESWNDERADMLRLPGIVACSPHQDILESLCKLAADWNPKRYSQ